MADPYFIGGELNFGSAPNMNSPDFGYAQSYSNAQGLNAQNYGNILGGYQRLLTQQQAAQAPIQQGFNNLTSDVLGGLQGVEASQAQSIKDYYTGESGKQAQNLISRGLGNTTVANSVQRGLALDSNKAYTDLANKIAQLKAGYQSSLGSQALNYGNTANMQNTALSKAQLDWMNSVNAPYPNAELYAKLAAQKDARTPQPGGGGTVRQPDSQSRRYVAPPQQGGIGTPALRGDPYAWNSDMPPMSEGGSWEDAGWNPLNWDTGGDAGWNPLNWDTGGGDWEPYAQEDYEQMAPGYEDYYAQDWQPYSQDDYDYGLDSGWEDY